MSITKPGEASFPFRWYYRPDPPSAQATPVVHIVESAEELSVEEIGSLLQEINDRQWQAIRQLFIEAKLRPEAQLRDENVIAVHGTSSFYMGGIAHLDH